MAQNEHQHIGQHSVQSTAILNLPTNTAPTMSSEEEMLADVDEPPDLERTPRPSGLKLHDSFKASFSKSTPRCDRKESLLSNALHSNNTSPVDEHPNSGKTSRGLSCISTWSNNSASTAELTSDGGLTSPGTRTNTPSPPLPASSFHNMVPIFNKKPFEPRVTIARNDDDHIGPLQKVALPPPAGEQNVEVNLGRKRCISFACGPKTDRKAEPEQPKAAPAPQQATEQPKRACTIKFACPTKISTDAPSKSSKPRAPRAVSPAPVKRPNPPSKESPKPHRGSDSTVRNPSPIAVRKTTSDRTRRLSSNSDLARCEAFRFHEFASSEEEIDEWLQESTCHRQPLTIRDTLKIENNLRKLAEEAEEEAVDEDEEDLAEGEDDDVDLDEDEDDDDENDSDAQDDVSSDDGFQTDDEEGFAVSDDDSDAGSDYNWWAPGHSTAATSIEHLEHIRPAARRSVSESSIGSVESGTGTMRYRPEKSIKRRRSRPVNIRIPSPELPDSTDFVCGTLDEDRPLEEAYLSAMERRRAAKHKTTPQDVDPTFPTSDPEMDEEDEDDEPDNLASESDAYYMMLGQMDNPDADVRGRRKSAASKRSPMPSPKRLRSPPPVKRAVHRSPPPRKLFGQSPKRLRSPPAPARLRSPPPTRRGSSHILSPKNRGLHIQFTGLAERPALTMSSSLPRTPISTHPAEFDEDDEDTPHEYPMRRAIDIKVGLEKKRQRRKEQLYKKMLRKGTKDKRPPPGKGCERMREVGLGLAAHKGKATGFGFHVPPTPDQKDMRILSV
ncbi:hypothetical protein K458DRAFT_285155 [Lentithecium fluviatile CBS 122367]|uniref:Uncharacterized protein n=1 Tax=Lentithecium fluviatile CBS 122367 TaxID=1168545 RepID=A0A6G1JPF1_9PLEO|nr:hypothetical protein K458DRAFT_285155 [Lentithecium fluviatile CBS 122367]